MTRAAKGLELEQAFAEWMKVALGYTDTKQRDLINGNAAKRPYEVDVHGQRYSKFWRLLHLGGLCALLLAIGAFLMPRDLAPVNEAVESTVASVLPVATGSGLIVLGLAAFVVGLLGKRKTTTHTWVECKNRKTSVKRADLEKLQGAVRDVRDNPRAEWKPQQVLMVSGSAFDIDALAIARAHGIECYQRTEQGFSRIK
jgi:hypothetical protein